MLDFIIAGRKANGKCTIYHVPDAAEYAEIIWEPKRIIIASQQKIGIAIGKTPLYLGKPVVVYKIITTEGAKYLAEAPYVSDQDDSMNIFGDTVDNIF